MRKISLVILLLISISISISAASKIETPLSVSIVGFEIVDDNSAVVKLNNSGTVYSFYIGSAAAPETKSKLSLLLMARQNGDRINIEYNDWAQFKYSSIPGVLLLTKIGY